jgi:transcriptional regulator with XRE-family HTH domain
VTLTTDQKMKLAKFIARQRARRGMSQPEFAMFVGLRVNIIRGLERGTRPVTAEVLRRLCSRCGSAGLELPVRVKGEWNRIQ